MADNTAIFYLSPGRIKKSSHSQVFRLSEQKDRSKITDEMLKSFRSAVKKERPALVAVSEKAVGTPTALDYSHGFVRDYQAITHELKAFAVDLDADLGGLYADKSATTDGNPVLAKAKAVKLAKLSKRMQGFVKTHLGPAGNNRPLDHVRYDYENGKVVRHHEGMFARGWRWVATKFAIGKKYYQSRSATSLFAALGRKYSLADIAHYAAAQLESEGKPITRPISPRSLAALSADGKMKLVEDLESRSRNRSAAFADVGGMADKVKQLAGSIEAADKNITVSDEHRRLLLPAIMVGFEGDRDATLNAYTAMSPTARNELTADIKKADKLTYSFLKIAAEGNIEEAEKVLGKLLEFTADRYRKFTDGAAEKELGYSVESATMMLAVGFHTLPRSLVAAAERNITPVAEGMLARAIKQEVPQHIAEKRRLMDELHKQIQDIDQAGGGEQAQGLKGQFEQMRQELKQALAPLEGISTHRTQMAMTVFGLVADLPKGEPAEQTWAEALTETIAIDDKKALTVTRNKKPPPLGSALWYDHVATAKNGFINAMREKYLDQRNMLLYVPPYKQTLAKSLDRLEKQPFISRRQALDLVSRADEADRFANPFRFNYEDMGKLLKAYAVGGKGWARLTAGKRLKNEAELNTAFLRRLLPLASNDDQELMTAFAELEAADVSGGIEDERDRELVDKKLGKLLGKLLPLQDDARAWSALMSMDKESKEVTMDYIRAISGGEQVHDGKQVYDIKRVYDTAKKIAYMAFRYRLMDPTITAYGDKAKIANGNPEDFNLGTMDAIKAIQAVIIQPMLEEVGSAGAKELAAKFKEIAPTLGWVDGASRAYGIAMMAKFLDKTDSAELAASPPSTPHSPPSIPHSPPRSPSSISGLSSKRGSATDEVRLKPLSPRRPLSMGSLTPFPPSSRAGKRRSAIIRSSNISQLRRSRADGEAVARGRSSVFSGIFPDDYVAATEPSPTTSDALIREGQEMNIKNVFRLHIYQMPEIISGTLSGLGALEQAHETINIYSTAMDAAQAITETALDEKISLLSADERTPQALARETAGSAEISDLGNSQFPTSENSTEHLPPAGVREQLLVDFKVFDKNEAANFLVLEQQMRKIREEAIENGIRREQATAAE